MTKVSATQVERNTFPNQAPPIILNAWEKKLLKIRILSQLFHMCFKETGNPFSGFKFLKAIRKKYQAVFGGAFLQKVAKVDGRYYWRLAAPGFPSPSSTLNFRNEFIRIHTNESFHGLRTLILSITNQCPLHCEHCYEWKNLNKKDALSTNEFIQIVHQYQEYGATQIIFSGGEPMLKINEVCQILNAAKPGTDFWMVSSGLGLSVDRAIRLKKAGLTGVIISLDHFDANAHDHFRGFEGAYEHAIHAVINANEVHLVTAVSLCATRQFVEEGNFTAYMELAKKLGVSFVQLLEPKASGKYAGLNVELNAEEIKKLETWYLHYNDSPLCQGYPIVNYLGYHQRKMGCFGAGDRFLYIDADGDAHACPFCGDKVANVLQFPVKDIIGLLAQQSCEAFGSEHISRFEITEFPEK